MRAARGKRAVNLANASAFALPRSGGVRVARDAPTSACLHAIEGVCVMELDRIDSRLPFAADVYPCGGGSAAAPCPNDPPNGGHVDRVFLLAPDQFGTELAPLFRAARAAVNEQDLQALASTCSSSAYEREAWRERAISIAQGSLLRRIDVRPETPPPVLHWHRGDLIVCVPTEIPGAEQVAAARVWNSGFNETVCVRARRIRTLTHDQVGGALARIERMQSGGVVPTIWRCELPSFCEASGPIAVEIAPNPTSFMHAMFIAHRGAAAIVVGRATGVGSTIDWNDEDESPLPRTRLLPSGWSYLKPDRSSGSSAPYFPNGAPVPINAVFLPDETLFRAIVRATWPVMFYDALRVAFAD
jgi:hypothetical protein